MGKRMKVLNGETEWRDDKITIEADTKHVAAVLKDLMLEEAKPVGTPGIKDRCDRVQQERRGRRREMK